MVRALPTLMTKQLYMALFTHVVIVTTRCTRKLLQGDMCRSSIDKMTRLIMKNMFVVAMGFNIYIAVGIPLKFIDTCRTNVILFLQAFFVNISYSITGN